MSDRLHSAGGLPLYKGCHVQHPLPVPPKEHTDPPSDVKAPTYIRSGCTDLRVKCLIRNYPLSSFKVDRPTLYRKFLRISSIKELWAMTRRHSRHSSNLSLYIYPHCFLYTYSIKLKEKLISCQRRLTGLYFSGTCKSFFMTREERKYDGFFEQHCI